MHTYCGRRLSRVLLSIVWLTPLLCILGILTPHAHAAQAALATCIGTDSVTWTPGVTDSPQPITIQESGQWLTCAQVAQGYSLLTNATSSNTLKEEFACNALLNGSPSGTWAIKWGDGVQPATSTYKWTGEVTAVDGNLVLALTGTIINGRYINDPAEATITYANLAATLENECAGSGVTSASGVATFTINNL